MKVKKIEEFHYFLEKITKTGSWEIEGNMKTFHGSPGAFEILGIKTFGNKVDLTLVFDRIANKEERERIEKEFYKLEKTGKFETEFTVNPENPNESGPRAIQLVCGLWNENKQARICGVFRDITEDKRLEKELLLAKHKAQTADRLKSAFLTNLSHEIRTPMNAILGFSELLRPEDIDREMIISYTSIIRSKANYLLSLIDDIIELANFESGKVAFNKSEFALYPLLQELYNEFETRRKEQNKTSIVLILNVPKELKDYTVYTDPGRLYQVLSNLLGNALKFTEKGSVEFGFRKSSRQVKLFVGDTGIGLTKDELSMIFHRFAEVEETIMKRPGGTGLSLTISKFIVEHLGGKIKVKSEPGYGSRFQINIPIRTPQKKDENMAYELESILKLNWKDKVILVAEDEEVNFRFLEAILQKTQAKILRARNGQEAVDLTQKISKIDLILMDIKMPVMNGYEAIIEIKKRRPDMPVIAQTAFSIHEEIEKCQHVGCDDYITKPIDINLLINKINKYFLGE